MSHQGRYSPLWVSDLDAIVVDARAFRPPPLFIELFLVKDVRVLPLPHPGSKCALHRVRDPQIHQTVRYHDQ